MDKELVCVGKIASPHGVKGAVKIKSFTSDPSALAGYSPLYNKDASKEFKIKTLFVKNDMVVVKIEGVDDRNEVAKLVNIEVFADKNRFGNLGDEEFFYDDLIGMAVKTEDGCNFGVVVSVNNYGGGDVIEVSSDGKESQMFAFTNATFPNIDVKNKTITIVPPEVEFVSDNDNT